MGDLSAHFSAHEFYCNGKTCGCPKVKPDNIIVFLLEVGRRHFKELYGLKVRVRINSGIRCRPHNEEIGGAEDSTHMDMIAVDAVFEIMEFKTSKWFPIDPQEVYDYYDFHYPDMLGLGLYDNRNHIDGRLTRARWDNRIK